MSDPRTDALRTAASALLGVADAATLTQVLQLLIPGAASASAQPAPAPAQPAPAPARASAQPAARAGRKAPPGPADRQRPIDPDLLTRLHDAVAQSKCRIVAQQTGLQDGQLRLILRTGQATSRLEDRIASRLGANPAVTESTPSPDWDPEAVAGRAHAMQLSAADLAESASCSVQAAEFALLGRAPDTPELRQWMDRPTLADPDGRLRLL
jgi:hypothetical protein